MKLVIVESPAKAKTINKYLGSDFVVLSSFGHTHDLPSKNGSILPEENFRMIYEISSRSQKPLNDILKYAKKCDSIYLATDLDREGEAISWHIAEEIKNYNSDKLIKRIVFNEITKNAILDALKNPHDINMQLVNAQQARRALDYLMGFNLSPILWKKLPSAKSAGRVQSVALRLICDRELEREIFIKEEYWSIDIDLCSNDNNLQTTLFELDGKKLDKFDINNQEDAETIVDRIKKSKFICSDIHNKEYKRKPYAPFITSTLQQEAIKKLGFSASQTMKIAQELYEGIKIGDNQTGLITYMRTDSTAMSQYAIDEVRSLIDSQYGKDYLPNKANVYKKGVNTQEAHECIHPSDFSLTPELIKEHLTDYQYKLYNLIWIRTIASQMADAKYSTTTIELHNHDHSLGTKAIATAIVFLGFIAIYGRDGNDVFIDFAIKENDQFDPQAILPLQHFTEPPGRFSEASLVKQLEELGIGRPSTYASILDVIVKRNYVILKDKKFVPTPVGRLVSTFLAKFFPKYVNNNFTAFMENELDHIAVGKIEWKDSLKNFWYDFKNNIDEVQKIENNVISETIAQEMNTILKSIDIKNCPKCNKKLDLKLSRFGIFLGCSGYSECKFTDSLKEFDNNQVSTSFKEAILLGQDNNKIINLCDGRYGHYLQLIDGDKKTNFSLPTKLDISTLTYDLAKQIVALPKNLGIDPITKAPVILGVNKVGFYVTSNKIYINIDVKDINKADLEYAMNLLNSKQKK